MVPSVCVDMTIIDIVTGGLWGGGKDLAPFVIANSGNL